MNNIKMLQAAPYSMIQHLAQSGRDYSSYRPDSYVKRALSFQYRIIRNTLYFTIFRVLLTIILFQILVLRRRIDLKLGLITSCEPIWGPDDMGRIYLGIYDKIKSSHNVIYKGIV